MEVWKEVRRRVLTKEISCRAACAEYHLGWQTLNKILTHAEPPGYRPSKPRPKRVLARFLPIIYQILEDDRQAPKKQRHTAHRIFERLDIDVADADAVRTIVEHRADRPVAFFSLDGRPQLQVVRVETTDPAAYQALLTEVTP